MTIELEMLDILKKYGIEHIRAYLEGENVRVKVYGPRTFNPKEYYLKNRDRIRSHQLEYYYKNREKINSRRREYYQKTKEYISSFMKEYYVKNRERIREYQHEYYLKNKEEISYRNHEYYLKIKSDPNNPLKKYYQENRDRIRKKQHEYYLRRKGIQLPEYSQRYIPVPADLAKAMAYLYSKNGIEANIDDLLDTAIGIMQFFGFEDEVVGNHLEHEDLALMYQLEDLGLVKTRIEEEVLATNKIWRANYFILDKKKIKEYAAMGPQKKDEFFDLYDNLPEEAWVR